MTVGRMRISCCIPNATNTHSWIMEYYCFSFRKKSLHKRAWILRYTHNDCRFVHLFRRSVSALRMQHKSKKSLITAISSTCTYRWVSKFRDKMVIGHWLTEHNKAYLLLTNAVCTWYGAPHCNTFTCKYNSHVRNVLQCHQHKVSLVSSFLCFRISGSTRRWTRDRRKIRLSCTGRPQQIQDFSYLFSCYFITDFCLDLLRIRLPLLYLWYIKNLPEKRNVDKQKFYFRCGKRQNRKCMLNITSRTCWCNDSCRGQEIGIIYIYIYINAEFFVALSI